MAEGKLRHGCLAAFLIFGIIANAAAVLLYTLGSAMVRRSSPSLPGWALPVLSIIGAFNLACFVAVFCWKKWGFYGCLASALVTFAINLAIGTNLLASILGLSGFAILCWVLQMGGENKGWRQLQ